ncbi:MAG TPA: aminopeptidase, partial [Clostridiaceae bacterium]|nr:aminopeptidase [Clostridiaceae bacterium]
SVLNTNLDMSKGNKINYRQICPTHAMLFTGVNIVNEKPNKYKVENSWGDKNGEKGFFIMSDEWFDEYMIEGIVNKKYIPDEIKKLFDQEPIKLPPWDVLSSLMK